MATWLITAALSTAIVGFVWLLVLAFRGVRRGVAGPATNCDGGSWMYFGAAGDSSHSTGNHGHDSGASDSSGHDSGGSDCGSGSDGGGGDGGGGGGD